LILKKFTMDIAALAVAQFDDPSVGQFKTETKKHSHVTINNALILLGFSSWASLEPSKSLY
jgi:hypothetical protein